MSIAILATKRAHGMLFAQVRLSDEAVEARLSAQALTRQGAKIPVVCRREEEGLWLLMAPPLAAAQNVHLTAYAQDGVAIEEQDVRFGHLSARVVSPMQVVRSFGRTSLQVPDERAALGEWDIWVDQLVATQGGYDVCQGHARMMGASRESVSGSLRVRAMNGHGHVLDDGAWTCLCDETSIAAEGAEFAVRYVEFSLRIPSDTSSLVVWIESEEEGRLADGFAYLGPRVMTGMRQAWRDQATPASQDEDYDVWFRTMHAASQSALSLQRAAQKDDRLQFSVVCVVRESEPSLLRATVDSVLSQSYEHFELVLVNAAVDNRKLTSALRGIELADARVRCVPLAADFGVAPATSAGIDAATGEFVCLLGEGDLLAPDALFCLSREIQSHPDAELLYTDEDELASGTHRNPRLKPEWDPDLLLGCNYLGGLLCVRSTLAKEIDAMDVELNGAQGYHIALYASTRARSISHVPRVLYHAHREHGEHAQGAAGLVSGLKALRQHLADVGESDAQARTSTRVPQAFELVFEPPAKHPLVSVVILNRDNVPSLDRCLTSLREHGTYEPYEVIVVENGSKDSGTFDYYRAQEEADERVRTVFYQRDEPFNEARLVNFGVKRTHGDYLLFLHNDIELTGSDVIERLAGVCRRAGMGAASARLVRADGTIESCGASLSSWGPVPLGRYRLAADEDDPLLSLLHATSIASGACLMVRRDAFEKVGGMREEFGSCLCMEDLCLRLWRHGLRVVVDPQVSVLHHRPLVRDAHGEPTVHELQSLGRLWNMWPFAPDAVDPQLGPLVDSHSAYRSLLM